MVLGEIINSCEYECAFHRYKIVNGEQKSEWHHPISDKGDKIGIYLCEAHHSIICGRKKRYPGEIIVDKSIDQMRIELKALERQRVIELGGNPDEIDKH